MAAWNACRKRVAFYLKVGPNSDTMLRLVDFNKLLPDTKALGEFCRKVTVVSYCAYCICTLTICPFMAKRHADNTLFSQSPAKKKIRSLCRVVDLQLESMAVYGGVSPSCTLALLSDRCRKRRHSLGISDVPQEEAPLHLKATNPDAPKESTSHTHTCVRYNEYLDSTMARKRRREESVELGTAVAKVYDKVSQLKGNRIDLTCWMKSICWCWRESVTITARCHPLPVLWFIWF